DFHVTGVQTCALPIYHCPTKGPHRTRPTTRTPSSPIVPPPPNEGPPTTARPLRPKPPLHENHPLGGLHAPPPLAARRGCIGARIDRTSVVQGQSVETG